MSRHLKRQKVPKQWPIERKGSVYVIKPKSSMKEGVPILIVLRDMLGLAQNRREVKKIIHSKQILINEKKVRDEKNNLLFFDTLSILPQKKYYRLELSEKGKFYLNEIKEKEANTKIVKVVNKKILKGKKIQLNLSDGRNLLSDIKCNINGSIIINLKEGKIEKCLPLKEKAKVVIFSGKHAGHEGEIVKLDLKEKTASVKTNDKEISILINQLVVIG